MFQFWKERRDRNSSSALPIMTGKLQSAGTSDGQVISLQKQFSFPVQHSEVSSSSNNGSDSIKITSPLLQLQDNKHDRRSVADKTSNIQLLMKDKKSPGKKTSSNVKSIDINTHKSLSSKSYKAMSTSLPTFQLPFLNLKKVKKNSLSKFKIPKLPSLCVPKNDAYISETKPHGNSDSESLLPSNSITSFVHTYESEKIKYSECHNLPDNLSNVIISKEVPYNSPQKPEKKICRPLESPGQNHKTGTESHENLSHISVKSQFQEATKIADQVVTVETPDERKEIKTDSQKSQDKNCKKKLNLNNFKHVNFLTKVNKNHHKQPVNYAKRRMKAMQASFKLNSARNNFSKTWKSQMKKNIKVGSRNSFSNIYQQKHRWGKKSSSSNSKAAQKNEELAILKANFLSALSKLDSNSAKIISVLAYIRNVNVPEFWLQKVCKFYELSLPDTIKYLHDIRFLEIQNTMTKTYRLCEVFQEVLRETAQNEGIEQIVLADGLWLLQRETTEDITQELPYEYYPKHMCEHLIQMYEHSFKYEDLIAWNLDCFSLLLLSLKSICADSFALTITKFLVHKAQQMPHLTSEVPLLLRLICCRHNILDLITSLRLLKFVFLESEDAEIKLHALEVMAVVLCASGKYQAVIPLCDQILTSGASNLNVLALINIKAKALQKLNQSSLALSLLRSAVKDSDPENCELLKSLILIAILSDDTKDIEVGLDAIESHLTYLIDIKGPLYPETLEYCRQRTKIVFKIEGRKTEALLELWRVYNYQVNIIGEEHQLTKKTEASIEFYVNEANRYVGDNKLN